ncbi:hypothetical protein EZ449_05785 [Pedobacter frigidisoli]|uniref:Uncharacterized protein n=1 Tax=Pedobacter frigidisoli TaxID=2530455 RepID=A0A4V2MN18_9SPHI|nr:hypothetical protein [Pedobacter frigidisoli]TCD11010.1 hypothetical protein EZ449_05785 [Pedobacter frigidisoli]
MKAIEIAPYILLVVFIPASAILVWKAVMDPNSQFGPALTFSADGVLASIACDKIMQAFAQDGNEKVKKLLIDNNRPEPISPQADKVLLKSPAFALIPKYNIYTRQDHAITIDLEKKMVAAAGFKNVCIIDSGHCPMLTNLIK